MNRSHETWTAAALAAGVSALAIVAAAAAAEEKALSVDDIVARTNRVAYYQGADGRAQVAMTIKDAQGRERTREFTILRRDEQPADDKDDQTCGEQKFYVFFHRPADVNKMVFMVHKHLASDDSRWLYLPALDLVKPIASTDKRTSFVGSNFLYEDVSGRRTTDDTHELAETTDSYYVLKNTPKDPGSVEFASFTMWVHRKTFVPVKIEYYDKKGEKYRVYEALKVETIDGYPTVTKSRMKDLTGGGETVLEYSDVKYNLGLPDDIFTERYLRQPPRKYLR
ncbi:MAG: outer membrane lipoprotein-sorting protein [Planctomycetes bacterium]|nr:outer membrane lipoprotein-sorting protein [Planctomycetota bacterium]